MIYLRYAMMSAHLAQSETGVSIKQCTLQGYSPKVGSHLIGLVRSCGSAILKVIIGCGYNMAVMLKPVRDRPTGHL